MADPTAEPEPATEPETTPEIEPEVQFGTTVETEPEVEFWPTVGTDPEFEPTVEIEPEIEPTSEIEFEPTVETEPEFEPTIETEPEYEPTIETEPEYEPTVETEPEFEPTIETEPEYEPTIETEPEFEPTVETEPEFEPTIETEPEYEPTVETEPEFEPTVASESEYEPTVASESEYEPTPEILSEPTVETEPEFEPTVEDEPQAEVEPEVEAEPETEGEPQGENVVSEEEPNAFAEDGVLSDHETIMWTCLYLLLIATTLVVNALIIRAMTKRFAGKRKKEGNCIKKPSDMFLLSLVVARMNVAGFVMPARIMGMFSSKGIGPVICKLCAFAGTGSATTSVLCTCAVGISKVIALQCNSNPSTKSVIIIIAILWTAGHIYALREPFLNDIVTRENSKGELIYICGEITKYRRITAGFMITDMLLLFVIPTIIVICASVTFIRLSSKPNPIIRLASEANPVSKTKSDITTGTMTGNGDILQLNKRKCEPMDNNDNPAEDGQAKPKLCRADVRFMAVIIMFLFIFCYAAAYTWKLLVFFDAISHLSMETALTIEQALFMWTFLNPILNACTYLYFRLDVRERFKSIFIKLEAEGNKDCVMEVVPGAEEDLSEKAVAPEMATVRDVYLSEKNNTLTPVCD